MLDFLRKGNADTMNKFIHSLRAAKQIHVAQEYLGCAREPDTQSRDGEWGDNERKFILAVSSTHVVAVALLYIQPYSQCIDRLIRCLANLVMWSWHAALCLDALIEPRTFHTVGIPFFLDVVVGLKLKNWELSTVRWRGKRTKNTAITWRTGTVALNKAGRKQERE